MSTSESIAQVWLPDPEDAMRGPPKKPSRGCPPAQLGARAETLCRLGERGFCVPALVCFTAGQWRADPALVEEMILEVSGVVMTRCLDDGSPHYVVTHGHESGRADACAAGNAAAKTVCIFKGVRREHFDSRRHRLRGAPVQAGVGGRLARPQPRRTHPAGEALLMGQRTLRMGPTMRRCPSGRAGADTRAWRRAR